MRTVTARLNIQERCLNLVVDGMGVVVRTSEPTISPKVLKNIKRFIRQIKQDKSFKKEVPF